LETRTLYCLLQEMFTGGWLRPGHPVPASLNVRTKFSALGAEQADSSSVTVLTQSRRSVRK